jgi:hypothetical protein
MLVLAPGKKLTLFSRAGWRAFITHPHPQAHTSAYTISLAGLFFFFFSLKLLQTITLIHPSKPSRCHPCRGECVGVSAAESPGLETWLLVTPHQSSSSLFGEHLIPHCPMTSLRQDSTGHPH